MKKLKPTDKIICSTSFGANLFTFIQVRKDAMGFIVDNSMQYLIYKVPAYENWVNDKILEDPFKLMQWLEKYENSEQYKLTGIKLPEGKFEAVGRASDVKVIATYGSLMEVLNIKPETTFILKKIS